MLLFVGTKPIQTQQLMLNGTIFTVNNQLYQFDTTVHENMVKCVCSHDKNIRNKTVKLHVSIEEA